MFVLIRAQGGILSPENEIRAFEYADDALDRMREEVEPEAECLELDDGDYGVDRESMHGFAGACDGDEWQVFEV